MIGMRDPLFSTVDLGQWLRVRQQEAAQAVDQWSADEIRFAPESVADKIVGAYSAMPLQLHFDRLSRSAVQEVSLHVGSYGETVRAEGQTLTITVPFEGEAVLLNARATSYSMNPPRGTVVGDALTFEITGGQLTAQAVKSQIERTKTSVLQAAGWANVDVARAETTLRAIVTTLIRNRKDRLDRAAALSADLDIPLTSAPESKRIEIPIVRKQVRILSSPEKRPEEELRLADTMYEDVLRTVSGLARAFERLPRTATQFKENELRDLVLFVLNSNYEGLARGETFNGQGKTDILLPYRDRNAFIGECKIWRNPKNFKDGIDQLLGYTVWRDTKGAVLLFIKQGEPSGIIDKADELIRTHSAFQSAKHSPDPSLRRDYLVTATSDPNRYIQLALLPIVVIN